jgi:hypothetical protein
VAHGLPRARVIPLFFRYAAQRLHRRDASAPGGSGAPGDRLPPTHGRRRVQRGRVRLSVPAPRARAPAGNGLRAGDSGVVHPTGSRIEQPARHAVP